MSIIAFPRLSTPTLRFGERLSDKTVEQAITQIQEDRIREETDAKFVFEFLVKHLKSRVKFPLHGYYKATVEDISKNKHLLNSNDWFVNGRRYYLHQFNEATHKVPYRLHISAKRSETPTCSDNETIEQIKTALSEIPGITIQQSPHYELPQSHEFMINISNVTELAHIQQKEFSLSTGGTIYEPKLVIDA